MEIEARASMFAEGGLCSLRALYIFDTTYMCLGTSSVTLNDCSSIHLAWTVGSVIEQEALFRVLRGQRSK